MKLGLLAIFKNESHILEEWLSHYLQQGVDHFYLINNASSDNFQEIINKHINFISLKEEPYVAATEILKLGGRQVEAYNEFLPEIDCDWLLICDLDEFSYVRDGSTIKNFIEKHLNDINQYLIPLKTFNSNKLLAQPTSVVKGFTSRWSVDDYPLFKPIVRVTSINKIFINYCTLKNGLTSNGTFSIIEDTFVTNHHKKLDKEIELKFRYSKNNDLINNSLVVCNHYTVQSKDWFFNIKATRGTATWHGGPSMPAIEWFTHIWNRIESRTCVEDLELLNLYEKHVNN